MDLGVGALKLTFNLPEQSSMRRKDVEGLLDKARIFHPLAECSLVFGIALW